MKPHVPGDATYLVDDVEELDEEGSEAAGVCRRRLAAAVREAMPERQPLLLNEPLEAVERPVERVEQQLGHRRHLVADDGTRSTPVRTLVR